MHVAARQEAAVDEDERERLWWLGSRLTVALEGLDEQRYEAVLAAEQSAVAVQPLTPDALALLEAQADALRESMAQRKEQSTTALLGRKQGDVVVDNAADRILDVLVGVEDVEALRALLPQAFVDDDDDGAAAGDDDQELLSTTPLLLLQAIERRLRAGAAGERLRELRHEVLAYIVGPGGE